MHLAGKASVDMFAAKACPLCFVNQKNPQGLNLDGWITHAADEALERDLARADGEAPQQTVVIV